MDERVARQAESAGGDALWRALQPLRSSKTWLMFGAHPDDEWNGFLAWLVLGRGMRAVFACATRGDGGQNAIGAARGADLAALRSREMERAAAEIGFGVRWLTPGGDDPIFDFGFSRSGVDTLARWGERRLVERMARAIREIRPDAVSPTFLDVPGQHGHHRAVTQSLVPAMALAADSGWDCGLPACRVEHAYLPAFPGGGGTYDDEVPPPPATVVVDLGARCEVLGASWAQIGEWSRRFHASQGMGRWIPDGPRPLALHKFAGPADRDLPLDDAAPDEPAVAAWPDREAVAAALERIPPLIGRKARELARAIALARGEMPRLAIAPQVLKPGGEARWSLSTNGAGVWRLPPGWAVAGDRIRVPADAEPLGTLRDGWDPLGGNDVIGLNVDGVEVDPEVPVVVAPLAAAAPDRVARRLGDPRPSVPPGRSEMPLGVRLARGEAAHVGTFARIAPASLRTLGLDCAIDRGARVGVAAGDTDETLAWLRQLGIDAFALDGLDACDVVLIGMMAFRQRPELDLPALHEWVRGGGKLVTLYHRPSDGWDPDSTPPRRIQIGTPSLRWRVTDPAAPIRALAPDSPLLRTPNAIGPGDWEGWVRERGLYFASAWDEAYRPLLELGDPGEPALRGALLEGRIGRGVHIHVALALHHQWEALVPGAFRLLANLVARAAD
jgi:LmbE family N-acetylglucosaminyl deacetylase